MNVTTTHQGAIRPIARGRLAMTAVLAGVMSTTLWASGTVGAATSHATKNVTISTSKTTKLGTFLVNGTTLYVLTKSDCNAKCLIVWPALLLPKGVATAKAGLGVQSSKLGTSRTTRGLQVTYGGKRLYWFFGDKSPGQVRGNNVKDQWGTWTIVVIVKPKSSGTTPTTAPSAGGTSF